MGRQWLSCHCRRQQRKLLAAAALCLLSALWPAPAALSQTVINANDRGWYSASGTHNPSNNNTFTGEYLGTIYRSYFRFSIPAATTCITAATLEIEVENYYGGGSPHTATFYDVDPANVPNLDLANGGGSGAAIHTDLGSGTVYGSQSGLTSASIGSVITINFPSSAFADITSAAGSDFAVGTHTTPGGGGTLRALRYSAGSEARIHRLTLTNCVFPDLQATKTTAIYDPGALGLYATPGNDVIYTITVSNIGPGSADTDTIFLADKIPADIDFYNGDIDDAGPELNPVSFADAGSGLTFTYATDIAYSNAAARPTQMSDCTYTPAAGYDPAITYLCINPKGVMAAGTPAPAFSVSFRARIN